MIDCAVRLKLLDISDYLIPVLINLLYLKDFVCKFGCEVVNLEGVLDVM